MRFRGKAIDVVSPAPIAATVELVDRLHPLSRMARRLTVLQLAGSESTAFLDGETGEAIAVFGFYAHPATFGITLFELWLMIAPDAGPLMLPMVRIARLTTKRLRETEGIVIRALVAKGHEPGRKLARMMGLSPFLAYGDIECFEWRSGGPVRQDDHRRADRQLVEGCGEGGAGSA